MRPERIFDLAIVSKIPVVFASITFALKILAPIPELADYYRKELAWLRVIARDAAVVVELWIRSRHGTWRFFLVTPSALVEIDGEGKRLEFGESIPYLAGVAAAERGGGPPHHRRVCSVVVSCLYPVFRDRKSGPVSGPVVRVLPHPPLLVRQ